MGRVRKGERVRTMEENYDGRPVVEDRDGVDPLLVRLHAIFLEARYDLVEDVSEGGADALNEAPA
jgi:hypothetical protein